MDKEEIMDLSWKAKTCADCVFGDESFWCHRFPERKSMRYKGFNRACAEYIDKKEVEDADNS